LSDDVDRTAAIVDAGENLPRRLCFSRIADEEQTCGGESTRKNARIEHNFLPLIWKLARPSQRHGNAFVHAVLGPKQTTKCELVLHAKPGHARPSRSALIH
jgi:hypothetical protein